VDHTEWQAAYRRAITEMDSQTAKDYIEDLWIEISELRLKVAEQRARLAALEAEREQWQRQAMSHD